MANNDGFSDDDDEILLNAALEWEKADAAQSSSSSSNLEPQIRPRAIQPSNSSSTDQPSAAVLALLKKYFGHSSFRPLQWQVIQCALSGRDQLVVMSTGYGKSVCYQMPSLIRENITLIVSPLISLMNDQVINVRASGVKAACLTGETKKDEREEILSSCIEGEMRLLYVTPEFTTCNSYILRDLRPKIGLIAIDEAHCVSYWGHEFRASYRDLAQIRTHLPGVPIMALTATATAQVRDDIVSSLGLNQASVVCSGLDRSNLYLEVRATTDFESLAALATEEDDRNGKHFGGPTIIYCPTRQNVEDVCDDLLRLGVKVGKYHAGMNAKQRAEAHENFSKDRITTIVATVAFGMGIDKADVRNVIHFGAPRNIASYYQEIGRAGRDGLPSKCVAFYTLGEIKKNRSRLIRDDYLREPYKSHALELQRHMETYLTSTTCRRFMILSHFDPSLQRVPPRLGCCDVCNEKLDEQSAPQHQNGQVRVNYAEEASIVFQSIEQVFRGNTGLGKVVDFIKGKANVLDSRQKHPLYGSGSKKTDAFWKEFCRILRVDGYFIEEKASFNDFAVMISLSKKAKKWLASDSKEFLVEPTPGLIGRIRVQNSQGTSYMPIPASGEQLSVKILGSTLKRHWKDCSHYKGFGQASLGAYSIELEKALIELRMDLAIQNDTGGNNIASNKCLQQIASIRPSCVENLNLIGEMPEAKRRKYGDKLVRLCVDFCEKRNLPMDCTADSELPSELSASLRLLSDRNLEVYRKHTAQRLNLAELSVVAGGLSESTIASYFANFIKSGLPVHLDVVKIDQGLRDTVLETIREHGSDVTRMKPIMEKLPEGTIDYNRLKIIFALLQYEYGIEGEEEEQEPPDGSGRGPLSPVVSHTDSQGTSGSSSQGGSSSKRTVPEWMNRLGTSTKPAVPAKKSRISNLFR